MELEDEVKRKIERELNSQLKNSNSILDEDERWKASEFVRENLEKGVYSMDEANYAFEYLTQLYKKQEKRANDIQEWQVINSVTDLIRKYKPEEHSFDEYVRAIDKILDLRRRQSVDLRKEEMFFYYVDRFIYLVRDFKLEDTPGNKILEEYRNEIFVPYNRKQNKTDHNEPGGYDGDMGEGR